MVDSKRYSPTIKRFQEHTKNFVEGKTKKGHLTDEDRKADDHKREEGILKRVIINKIRSNGWEVKVDKKTYMCTYGDNIIYLPPYTKTKEYYIPKSKCKVEVNIDKKSKIYTITKINDENKQPIEMNNEGLTLQGSGLSSLSVVGDVVEVEGEYLQAANDIKIDTTNDKDLPNEISVKSLYQQVQIIQEQINSGTNDS